ncbi:MAG: serine/threonine protein phosphatase [Bradymonadales bacterium]|nr:serine/threonine protein phosphatase [Bradymonadales bacterium]
MIEFSRNSDMADEQARAVMYTLITFGYVDGDFDITEKEFIRDYIEQMAEWRVMADDVPYSSRQAYADRYHRHFLRVFESIDAYVKSLFTEAVANGEDIHHFVISKLKVKCFEHFEGFDQETQDHLLEVIDGVIVADGKVHPKEAEFRKELAGYLHSAPAIVEEQIKPVEAGTFEVTAPVKLRLAMDDHPMFRPLEVHFSADTNRLMSQATQDYRLMDAAADIWQRQRRVGDNILRGRDSVDELDGEDPFLDGHVYGLFPKPWEHYELIVLGDLHGCHSCLKAAVLQSDFFRKVEAFRRDPKNNPNVKLVLLGDYIDRGIYSYNGTLRTALQLFANYPDHVYLLRGNHEYYIEHDNVIISGVAPAEAIATLAQYLPMGHFRAYKDFFEQIPVMLLFGRTLFVHAGIPKDNTYEEKWVNLGTLNDKDIRLQMMWSDPSDAAVIPKKLQEDNTRFSFGRRQFRRFMGMIGANTMIRGHEKIDDGFTQVYDDQGVRLFTLFSAGGRNNNDLPQESSYREVTPMALTVTYKHGAQSATPWYIDYEPFNSPSRNGFYRSKPEIE